MGVAQYKVAEDHLFAALKGAPRSVTDLIWAMYVQPQTQHVQSFMMLPNNALSNPKLHAPSGFADGVEVALANPNTITSVLTGLALVVLPGDVMP